MNHLKLMYAAMVAVILCSCAPKSAEESISEESPMSYDTTMVSSSAAVVGKSDSGRAFIRTADLRFKVKSVVKSTYDIENICSRVGGFVTNSDLNSVQYQSETNDISLDSAVLITRFAVTNNITMRVPNIKLDTTLKLIARNIVYLDSRVIQANDVAIQMLSNKLTMSRTRTSEQRLKNAIDHRGKKLMETTEAEELLLNKQEQADAARVENLSLADQINFSTINLVLYQNEEVAYEPIARDKYSHQYEPSFGFRIVDALMTGWRVFETLVVYLLHLWGVVLLGVVAFWGYKFYKRKFGRKKVDANSKE